MTTEDSVFLDQGLLSPVTAGQDALTSDTEIFAALLHAEVALVRAWEAVSDAPASVAEAVEAAASYLGPQLTAVTVASAASGNPVIPLVRLLREAVPERMAEWVHRGATSQDIFDSALMLVAARAAGETSARLRSVETRLATIARRERDTPAAARTLTQHAVPTTVGLRVAAWLGGVRRARRKLDEARAALPAQLGGAAGTLASFVELSDAPTARRLVMAYAGVLGLAVPRTPWHTTRWPVTELGNALVQAIDAVGAMAADVATLSRTEIGEVSEGVLGGSSAMPQKRNPAGATLIRSAALRAPQLGASLHLSAALAGDERPDGAWHAEWPVLRELLRLALGASAAASRLALGLRIDPVAVARNLAATGGLIVSERIAIVLTPILGADRVAAIVAAAEHSDFAGLVADALRDAGEPWPEERVAALLDPAEYTGLAVELVDDIVGDAGMDREGEG